MARPRQPLPERAVRLVGTTLNNKYQIKGVLGCGGMATVYLGVHRNGNKVAIKLLREELSLREDIRARFVREGYVANAVGHPGAVRILDDDIAESGAAFLVMELLEGETLSERRRRLGGRRPCREVLALGHQLLDVLTAAHARGIVHRDIKPENLFLTTSRTLKVLDFGIARILDDPSGASATMTGTRLGTPAFMPPEQALGRAKEVDGRSDIWSSGATLFTLLSGETVHLGETPEEIAIRSATQPARSLAGALPDVPPAVAALVDRALAFSRDERWQNARAMQEALEHAYEELYGEPVDPSAIAMLPEPLERITPVETPRSSVATENADTPVAPTEQPTGTTLELTPPETRDSISPAPPSEPAPPPRRIKRSTLLAFGLGLVSLLGGLGLWAADSRERPASPPPVAKGCTQNRACVAENGGHPAICRKDDGVCVPLETSDCKVLAEPGDIENDATVWIGAMFPFRHPNPTHYGPRSANAVNLARIDFAETTGGLPPLGPDKAKRPIAVVLCDDQEHAHRVARHLVNEVRVPAILGFARSKEVLELSQELFLPKRVFALAANTASTIRDIPRAAKGEPRLVWRVTTSVDVAAPAVSELLHQRIEPELHGSPGLLGPSQPIRLAVVRANGAAGQDFADLLVSRLQWNGRSVVENGDNFRQIIASGRVVDDLADNSDLAENRRIAAEIAVYQPHIVISASSEGRFIPATEEAWPARARFRPRYLLPIGTFPPDLMMLVRKTPELRRRILAINTLDNTEVNDKYLVHYNERFSPPMGNNSFTNAPYDAFYVFAYAAASLGDRPITGLSLASSIPRLLPPGEPIDVGPGGIYPAFYALASGKNIDLQGSMTTLDFDLETGDAAVDTAIFCLVDAPADKPLVVESGLVFRARSGKLEGTYHCP